MFRKEQLGIIVLQEELKELFLLVKPGIFQQMLHYLRKQIRRNLVIIHYSIISKSKKK